MTDQKKTLTKDDVKTVAVGQIKMNGKTTTLDVKNELRVQGFWAEQNDVKKWMLELAKELNWKRTHENGHYSYTDNSAGQWWSDDDSDSTKDANGTSNNGGGN